jgi:hypothetical protein
MNHWPDYQNKIAANSSRNDWPRGLCARILVSGDIEIGDRVEVLSEEKNS